MGCLARTISYPNPAVQQTWGPLASGRRRPSQREFPGTGTRPNAENDPSARCPGRGARIQTSVTSTFDSRPSKARNRSSCDWCSWIHASVLILGGPGHQTSGAPAPSADHEPRSSEFRLRISGARPQHLLANPEVLGEVRFQAGLSIHSGSGVMLGSGFLPGPSRPVEVTVIRCLTLTSWSQTA